jgi:hypothetical protein
MSVTAATDDLGHSLLEHIPLEFRRHVRFRIPELRLQGQQFGFSRVGELQFDIWHEGRQTLVTQRIG